jgi:carbamoyl-phosphate synthase large subunit
MPSEKINILMTGGGAPGAAGILHCLKQEKSFTITVADANPGAVGRWLSDDFADIPPANDEKFIDAMLTICRQKNIHVVLPLVTKELLPLARHKKEFEAAGTKIIVSPADSLAIANDKCRLYEFLQKNRIRVPEFRVVKTIDEFTSAAAALHYPEKDICFKPAVSNGSRGFRIISARMNELDLLLNHKPASVYMNLENAIRILSSGEFPELLVSEYLAGDEYAVDCLVKKGVTVLSVPRLRIKTMNGISVEGEFVNEEALIVYSSSISESLQLHGNIGYQVKKSGSGEFLILEINPRVQGAISSALGAGINLPVLAIKQELGLPVAENEMQVKWGIKFSRYWSEVFH